MRSYRKELWCNVPGRRAFINITGQVEQRVAESGVHEGLALVNAMHITGANLLRRVRWRPAQAGVGQDHW